MAWNHERSTNRLREEAKRVAKAGITVKPLTREMNLANLSTTDTRLVTGVHLYADIRNLDALLDDLVLRRDNYKRLYRTLHLTRRELRRILQPIFGGDKIQVQGTKFHGLLFRPYNDPELMARDAIRAGMAMYSALTEAFSSVCPTYPALIPAIGIDYGECLIANIGIRGDRELISIGNAANNAAKILVDGNDAITIGSALYEHLSDDDQARFTAAGNNYRLDCTTIEDLEETVREEGAEWTIQSSINHLSDDKDALPLDDINIEEAREIIDITRLGKNHAKTVPAASIFVDIDGYTSLVESLNGDTDELAKAVQVLHLFRYELQQVTENDHHGITIQHQGDRLQALFHAPDDDDETVMDYAANLCTAYNSSVEAVINQHHDILGKLHVAIGCAFGHALVGMLGVSGDRDPVCIGHATLRAENVQLAMKGNQLGVIKPVYEAISDDIIADEFTWNAAADCYEADGITFAKIGEAEDAKDAKAYATATTASYTTKGAIIVGTRATAQTIPLKITRPYCA
jgi:class 3 adenylate cyclase